MCKQECVIFYSFFSDFQEKICAMPRLQVGDLSDLSLYMDCESLWLPIIKRPRRLVAGNEKPLSPSFSRSCLLLPHYKAARNLKFLLLGSPIVKWACTITTPLFFLLHWAKTNQFPLECKLLALEGHIMYLKSTQLNMDIFWKRMLLFCIVCRHQLLYHIL